jgi:DNA ligase (NAD+)
LLEKNEILEKENKLLNEKIKDLEDTNKKLHEKNEILENENERLNEKIKDLEGWGDLSVSNLKYSLDDKKKISLDKFIYSLGIRHIGLENAKLLAKHLKSSDKFFKLSTAENMSELVNIDGIGEAQIQSIKNFFSNKVNLEVLLELKKILKITNVTQINQIGVLKNKTFMLTGKLQGMSRAEAKSLIEQNSGKIISNVNKKLDYLIAGEKPTMKKVNNAKELNIKVITQDEWIKMLNMAS